jgi:hypothetical protein
VSPQGLCPQEELGECIRVSRCYQWGRRQGCCSQSTPSLASYPWLHLPHQEMHVSVYVCSPKAIASPWLAPCPSWAPAPMGRVPTP